MIEIKDRALKSVGFSGIDSFTYPDGQRAIGATCHITLIGADGVSDGPGANVFVAVPISTDLTLKEAEHAVLARAHDILGRLASFSVAELEQAFERIKLDEKAAGFRDFHEPHN
jgi:hypothetical protein